MLGWIRSAYLETSQANLAFGSRQSTAFLAKENKRGCWLSGFKCYLLLFLTNRFCMKMSSYKCSCKGSKMLHQHSPWFSQFQPYFASKTLSTRESLFFRRNVRVLEKAFNFPVLDLVCTLCLYLTRCCFLPFPSVSVVEWVGFLFSWIEDWTRWPVGFPGGTSGKEPACQCRRRERGGFVPWVRKVPRRRAWQPTPVFLPGEFCGQRSLVGL